MKFTWEEHVNISEEDFQTIINTYIPPHRQKQKKVRSHDIRGACLGAVADYYDNHLRPYIRIPIKVQMKIADEVQKRYEGD